MVLLSTKHSIDLKFARKSDWNGEEIITPEAIPENNTVKVSVDSSVQIAN